MIENRTEPQTTKLPSKPVNYSPSCAHSWHWASHQFWEPEIWRGPTLGLNVNRTRYEYEVYWALSKWQKSYIIPLIPHEDTWSLAMQLVWGHWAGQCQSLGRDLGTIAQSPCLLIWPFYRWRDEASEHSPLPILQKTWEAWESEKLEGSGYFSGRMGGKAAYGMGDFASDSKGESPRSSVIRSQASFHFLAIRARLYRPGGRQALPDGKPNL